MREKEKRPETLWFQAFADTSDEEDRTLDLTDANRTLSQLSYAPKPNISYYNKGVKKSKYTNAKYITLF